jgi:hypothetical protein
MKRVFILLVCTLSIGLQSCVVSYSTFCMIDNNETIQINSDGTFVYSFELNLHDFANNMGLRDKTEMHPAVSLDTTILFNNLLSDTTLKLTGEQKQMFRNGSAKLDFDILRNKEKVMVKLFCENMTQLNFARENIFSFIITNTEFAFSLFQPKNELDDVIKQLVGQMGIKRPTINFSFIDSNMQDPHYDLPLLKAFNPIGKTFSLKITSDSIQNSFDDLQAYEKAMSSNETLKSLRKTNPYTGKVNFKTTIITPKKIKSYRGQLELLSPDRKTITFKSTLSDILSKPAATGYFVSFE